MAAFFKRVTAAIGEHYVFCDAIFLLSLLAVGGFNDFVSAIISVAFLVFLFIKLSREKSLRININLLSISVFVMVCFYALTVFWAIDSGMAFIGFLKYLPILLYLILLQQGEKKQGLFDVLPFFAAVLVLLSSLGSLIPSIKGLFLVSGRLSGFFQYPNTFALFLLICELLVLKKKQYKIIDFVVLAILVSGLLYTGSRTVFIIFLATNFFMILINSSKKWRIWLFSLAALLLILVLAFALLGKDGNVLSRYLKIGLSESTFVGRLLYITDALPLLLKYPFGLGYLGYHFIQGSFQTGVYNVSYVHNDFLQIALDVGLVPMLLFLAAIVAYLFKKQVPLADKIIVAAFVMHSMFDFNLQFASMFMLFVALLNTNDGKQIDLSKGISVLKVTSFILVLVNIYMCISLALSQFTAYEAANTLYPFNTRNKLLLLEQQEDVTVANEIADDILKYNTYYYAPYSVKAKYCYSKGDFVGVIENKNAVFLRNRFRYTEFKEYGVMLVNGILAYEQIGDTASADILKKELISLKNGMESNKEKISKLGSMINEQPITTLPAEILKYIDEFSKKAGD
ncbi:MAG: O-antigen ligase family protein [Clostridia bacterium]|nr:O-antigen ligase family protein [Clostridia bacterium]